MMIRRFIYSVVAAYFILWLVHLCEKGKAVGSRPPHVAEYVATYGRVAAEVGQQTGVPPSIILAVAGLESAWGASELSRRGNHFGIKAWGSEPKHCLPTLEFEKKRALRVRACFRAYDDPKDSFRDFGRLLSSSPNYQSLFQLTVSDYRRWAHGLSDRGYATDPRYAEKLIRIIKQYRLDVI